MHQMAAMPAPGLHGWLGPQADLHRQHGIRGGQGPERAYARSGAGRGWMQATGKVCSQPCFSHPPSLPTHHAVLCLLQQNLQILLLLGKRLQGQGREH